MTGAFQRLSGWGRYPVQECRVFRPERCADVRPPVLAREGRTLIPRGLGRSYGDAAINGGGDVLDYSRMNRMRAFDAESGVLECEAGVSLADILDVFVPRGFFPPVMPGTKFVTLGGAIANDVHGKNHHRDGSFSQFVEQITLLTPSGEVVTCSPEEQPDVFWATAGGVGLTGVILEAKIRLKRIETAYCWVDYLRTKNIDDTLAAFAESDRNYEYSVAWVDCLAKGDSLGRSVLMRGNFAARADAPPGCRDPLQPKPKHGKPVPFDFPGFVLNSFSIGVFNQIFYALHPSRERQWVDYDSYFCPLDSIHHWNRMYGRRGFCQYQVTFPIEEAGGLTKLMERVSQSGCASFLAVLKRLGPGGPGLLSYPSEGYTISFDIPMRNDVVPLLREFDQRVLEHNGRLYCAKDAVALPETFAAMYPRLDEFRTIAGRLDPDGAFSSSLARRLGIVRPPAGGSAHE